MQSPNRRRRAWPSATVLYLLLAAGLTLAAGRVAAQDNPPAIPSQEEPTVLTSGPVNEAFAAPVNVVDQGGTIAPSAPPPPIDEVPSADRPTGDQYDWIPGYWSWDTQRTGWVWVSACWRAVPPGMAWVPGYWTQEPEGYEWIPGFWTPTGTEELQYLPTPPDPVDISPVSTQPSYNDTWVPGCQYWVDGRYVPRRGYWLQQQHGWIWTPSHMARTPGGYVFCRGHWDYSLDRRGVLFAPVYVPRNTYNRPGYSFEPSITISLLSLTLNLFASPRYSHYYVGDYYAPTYEQQGIFPQFQSQNNHACYDPLYQQQLWLHHGDQAQWQRTQQQTFDQRRNDPRLRPAQTYHEEQIRVARMPASDRRGSAIAQPLAVVIRQAAPNKFERATPVAHQAVVQQAAAVHAYQADRQRWEAKPSAVAPARVVAPRPTVAVGQPQPPVRAVRAPDVRPQVAPQTAPRAEPVKVKIPPPPVAAAKDRGADRGRTAPPAADTKQRDDPPAKAPPPDKAPPDKTKDNGKAGDRGADRGR